MPAGVTKAKGTTLETDRAPSARRSSRMPGKSWLIIDWPGAGRLLTFTVPRRLTVPEVSVVETVGDLVADTVGKSRRTLAKRNDSARIFFIKRTFSPASVEYNGSEHKFTREGWNQAIPKGIIVPLNRFVLSRLC